MANFFNRVFSAFNFLDEEDDDYDEDDYDEEEDDDDEEEDVKPSFFSRNKRSKAREEDLDDEPAPSKRPASNNIVSYNQPAKKPAAKTSSQLLLRVIKPVSLEDGRDISDTLTSGRAVVLNLEDVDADLAQRIIDFSSGACYSIGGNLLKISTYIFVVTPSSIDVSGDISSIMNAVSQSQQTANVNYNAGGQFSSNYNTNSNYGATSGTGYPGSTNYYGGASGSNSSNTSGSFNQNRYRY
ncbi:MAG: cell division protein SepF [Lachnospiraceae bacterium]|nr:cell division protein SepF [Lachnospiraceae bacterium]